MSHSNGASLGHLLMDGRRNLNTAQGNEGARETVVIKKIFVGN